MGSHETVLEAASRQYQAVLHGIVQGQLREACTHEIRRLFAVNALHLATIQAWRCALETGQRIFYEGVSETVGRVREKEDRYAFLREETFGAVESLQLQSQRKAGHRVQVLLLGLGMLTLFSVVFEATDYMKDGDGTFRTFPAIGLELLNSGAARLTISVVLLIFTVLAVVVGNNQIRRT
jgi:hypothetical protein